MYRSGLAFGAGACALPRHRCGEYHTAVKVKYLLAPPPLRQKPYYPASGPPAAGWLGMQLKLVMNVVPPCSLLAPQTMPLEGTV
jgi:hypothetical protein